MSELMSPEELASELGISVHTIYAKTSRKQNGGMDLPPWVKIGKFIRFPREDFKVWLSGKERHGVGEARQAR